MKHLTNFVLLLILVPLAFLAQEVLTNDSVVKMVKAELPESVILQMVQNQPGQYVLNTDAVIALKRQGVPASVLNAMINKGKPTPGTPRPTEVPPRSEEPATSGWSVRDVQDKMTDEYHVEASTVQAVEQGARVRVTATCAEDPSMTRVLDSAPDAATNAMKAMGLPVAAPASPAKPRPKLDTRQLTFRFQYIPKAGSRLALKRSPVAQQVVDGTMLSSTTITPAGSCVFMRVAVGQRGRAGVQSELCDIDNAASLSFINLRGRDVMSTLMPGGAPGKDNTLGNIFSGLADMADTSIATIDEVFRAGEVRVELPLTDGDSVLVKIAPQEPAFELFGSNCGVPIVDPRRGYLGAGFGALPPEQVVPGKPGGVLINELTPEGPAAKAGLRSGDLVTAIDAQRVESANQFTISILSHPPGTTAAFKLIRDGKPMEVAVTVGRRPPVVAAAPPTSGAPAPGRGATPLRQTGPPAPVFTGTPQEFAAAFPGFLERAAKAKGVDPHDFEKEAAFIINTMRTCLSIPEKDVRKWGPDYQACRYGASSSNVRTWDPASDLGIVCRWLMPSPIDNLTQGRGFTGDIFFNGNKSLPFPIVRATIK